MLGQRVRRRADLAEQASGRRRGTEVALAARNPCGHQILGCPAVRVHVDVEGQLPIRLAGVEVGDYWDYIGWKDKFSKAEYSERQRKGAAFGGAGFVYTPQFVMNGRDFKSWDNSRLNEAVEKNQNIASRANLTLNTVAEVNGDITLKASAQATKTSDAKNSDVFIALYENKLVSKVNAGENSGSTLKHDYVVREFFGAYQISNQNEFSKNFTLNNSWKNKDGGAVIFVQNSQTGEILQSLALPFCKS